MSDYRLTHLKELEAESIHIIREVAAEFDNPVMMYSIGKDSTVMLHLARKAFHPGKLPFPLMHVDTTWKFQEMIAFRDKLAQELGLDLIVHKNQEGIDAGVSPFTHGSAKHTDIMKTEGLKQGLNKYGFDAVLAARAEMKKNPVPKSGFIVFETKIIVGIQRINALNFGIFTTVNTIKARRYASSLFPTGPS